MSLNSVTRSLSANVEKLRFSEPVAFTYNPLAYARRPMETYLETYGSNPKEVLLVGMNPGPFGMAQTGVPFGDVAMVRDWLGITAQVDQPKLFHPKRPVHGFDCSRGEVSGQRLWGWARDRYTTPKSFFKRFFVWNYCPLCFVEESGRNRTPDKLPPQEREALFKACDAALAQVIEKLDPKFVIGVGKFALDRIENVVPENTRIVGSILHPSPASPAANRGWAKIAEGELKALGIAL